MSNNCATPVWTTEKYLPVSASVICAKGTQFDLAKSENFKIYFIGKHFVSVVLNCDLLV
jgi:hypothetical protein